ncbi:metaxin-1 [Plakobranchus ocellatus]|uniref:Metaxin n=1 Tax=Plakobranchus ocellatus TaxID=259542 RepID=A0AAV3XXN2_9GAST|nr:metaxin-1 [Plakobranchus ocellatus]
MAAEKMKLDVWKGDWGLPSVDPHCLAVLAYCKYSGVPVEVNKTGNPWSSPTGNFPVLRHRGETYCKITDIFNYLRKEHWGSDFELSTKQSADVVAFSALLEEKLLPALLHLWWMDDKTFIDVTRPWYSRAIPFPLSLFLPGRTQKKAELRVNLTKGGENISEMETETKVYKEAKECLNLLSYKLGEKQYMFGRLPSSLDALVFGYLAPLLKAPLPNNQLHNHLLQCENLCRMVNDVLVTFFPADLREMEEKQKKEEQQRARTSSSENSEFPNRRRNMVLAGFFALSAMAVYAWTSGLIQIQISDLDPAPSPAPSTTRKAQAVKGEEN